MLESIGFGYLIVMMGALVFFVIKSIFGGLADGVSKLTEKPEQRSPEDKAYEALHCKPGEHVYGKVEVKRYSENNDGTDIRMDEKGMFYMMVYNMKTGESHRLSAKYIVDLQEMMDSTFKSMAENEKAMEEAERIKAENENVMAKNDKDR